MTEIWLTRGLPASGKSTWAKQMVKDSGGKVVRVNMDDIRSMLGFGPGQEQGLLSRLAWSKELENTALEVQDKAILSAVKMGHDVVVDNTHIEQKMPKRIKGLFDGDVDFYVQDFSDVPTAICVARDWERGLLGGRSVGSEVIAKMANRMKNAKWKLTEEWMNDVVLSPRYFPKFLAKRAIVVDIDGTLARHDFRSPYNYDQLHTDGVHVHISSMVYMYKQAGYSVIIMSGRPDTHRAATEKWLADNYIEYDELFMRAGDDRRNDADVKQDLFDQHVREDYDVEVWLDDRDRVVRRMRKLGINVAQVADGDF